MLPQRAFFSAVAVPRLAVTTMAVARIFRGVQRLAPRLILAGLALGLTLPHAAKANLIICNTVTGNLVANCGFETGDFTGWTQGGNTANNQVAGTLNVISSGQTYVPNSGSFQAQVGPVGSDGTLSQSFATNPGDSYMVSFYVAAEGGSPSDFSANFDGTTILSLTSLADQNYTLYTETIAATGSTSNLTFTFRSDPGFELLDDVSVADVAAATPEPGTWVLLGMGLLWIAAARSRPNRQYCR